MHVPPDASRDQGYNRRLAVSIWHGGRQAEAGDSELDTFPQVQGRDPFGNLVLDVVKQGGGVPADNELLQIWAVSEDGSCGDPELNVGHLILVDNADHAQMRHVCPTGKIHQDPIEGQMAQARAGGTDRHWGDMTRACSVDPEALQIACTTRIDMLIRGCNIITVQHKLSQGIERITGEQGVG